MSQNSCLLGEEDTTVPGWEESAPQVDDLLRLVFKIQCFIIIIRGFIIIIRDKQDPQIVGNVALILIQVVLFALLQLVEYYDKVGGGCLVVSILFVLLVVFVALFIATARIDFPSIIFLVQGLIVTIVIPNFGRPDSAENSGASTVEQPGAGENGLSWILLLIGLQAVNLGLAWRASTKIKSTWKTA